MNAIVFHWWNNNVKNIEEDFFNPILLSVACIRYFNISVPIYVIDISNHEIDWLDYDKKLNFKIIKKQKRFSTNKNFFGDSMSRIWDISDVVNEIPEKNIIFNDADVLWVQNPFPLLNSWDKFNCNKNNGVFYFCKENIYSCKFIELWKERNFLVMFDETYRENFYKRIKISTTVKTYDELVFKTILNDYPDLYKSINLIENCIIFSPIKNPKNIHFIKEFCGNKNRILSILSIQEITEKVISVLGENFYGKKFINKLFSIKDLNKKSVIEYICSFGGNYKKATNYRIKNIF